LSSSFSSSSSPSLSRRESALLQRYEGQANRKGVNANFPLRSVKHAIKAIGGKIGADGVFSHPATPNLVMHRMTVKKLAPLILDAVRFKLASDLAVRSDKRDKNGKPGRLDFQSLQSHLDWDATLSFSARSSTLKKGGGLPKKGLRPLLLCSLVSKELVKGFIAFKNRCTLGCSR
jgi:hypothetical protein